MSLNRKIFAGRATLSTGYVCLVTPRILAQQQFFFDDHALTLLTLTPIDKSPPFPRMDKTGSNHPLLKWFLWESVGGVFTFGIYFVLSSTKRTVVRHLIIGPWFNLAQ